MLRVETNVPIDERETTVNIYATDNMMSVYSSDPVMLGKLFTLAEQHPDDVKVERADQYGATVILPQKWLKIAPPIKRNLTDEQRAEMSARAKKQFAKHTAE